MQPVTPPVESRSHINKYRSILHTHAPARHITNYKIYSNKQIFFLSREGFPLAIVYFCIHLCKQKNTCLKTIAFKPFNLYILLVLKHKNGVQVFAATIRDRIMDQYYFISDVHLGHSGPDIEAQKEQILISLLGHVRKNGRGLFIVGDLFDFWFEYKSAIPPYYFSVLAELKKCVESGVDVRYITGNHDFWMFDFFPVYLGIPVYREHLEQTIGTKRFFITHGDGLAKNDYGYRLLKAVTQNKMSIWLFKLIHPDISFAVARFFSRLSRNHREVKDQDADYVTFAEKKFAEGYDAVVMGHTHRAMIHISENKVYVNTGEWFDKFTYGKFCGSRLSLETWPAA